MIQKKDRHVELSQICSNGRDALKLAGLTFFVSLLLLMIACMCGGIFPFGKTAMLREDAIYQYVGFFGWFSRVLKGEANLFYSFSKGLGGSTIGLYAYYLASPLNLMMGFFKPEDAPKVMTIIIIVKLCLMASSMAWFLKRRFNACGYSCILAGVSYGLAACNFVSGSNLMWLDGAIMLPIVCMAIHSALLHEKPYVLSLLIAYTVIVNWYAGYQICLFSFLWTLYECSQMSTGKKGFFKSTLMISLYLIIGLMISGLLFVPTVLDLLSTGSAPSTSSSGGFITVSNLYALLAKWNMGNMSIHPDSSGMAGGLYINSLLMAGCLALPFVFKNNRKEIGILTCLIGFLLLCELFQPLSLLWTGFSRADSYNPRFHYLIVFLLGIIFSISFDSKQDRTLAASYYYFPFLFLSLAGLFKLGYISNKKIVLFQVLALVISTAFIWTMQRGRLGIKDTKLAKIPSLFIFLLVCVELVCPIVLCFTVDSSTPKLNVETYSSYIRSIARLVEDSKATMENTRLEHCGITYLGSANRTFPTGESMALGINGADHYSSAGRQSQKDLLGSLGYCGSAGTRGIVYYNSSLPVSDLCLGVGGLIVSDDAQYVYNSTTISSNSSPYGILSLVGLNGSRSIAYLMNSDSPQISYTTCPFENQEKLANSIFGVDSLYHSLHPVEDSYKYGTGRELSYQVKDEGPLYVFVKSEAACDVYVNGKLIQNVNDWEFSSNIVSLGDFHSGDTVRVLLKGGNVDSYMNGSVDCRQLDESSFSSLIERSGENAVKIDTFDDGLIKAHVSLDKSRYCFFSVPFEKGWTASINGAPVNITEFYGMMALPLSSGDNDIVLTYKPVGIIPGVVTSVLGLVILGVVIIYVKKH